MSYNINQHIYIASSHRNRNQNLPHIRPQSSQHEESPSEYQHELNMIIKSLMTKILSKNINMLNTTS